MTAPALKALAERVEAHSLDEFGACRCGWQAEDEEDPFPEWSMHVAAVLAPLVAGEVAMAWAGAEPGHITRLRNLRDEFMRRLDPSPTAEALDEFVDAFIQQEGERS